MLTVINVVAPVFAIVVLGYIAVRFKLYPASGVGGLIAFVNGFATPLLLFRAALTFETSLFVPLHIVPFYIGAIIVFVFGIFFARNLFKNRPGEAVSAGFSGMFSNTVLLGIPISQRAFGDAAMPTIFAIIAVHAALLFTIGMVTMELARQDGEPLRTVILKALRSLIQNPLLIGLAAGFLGNMVGLQLPIIAHDFLAMMIQAVVPVALFGLGGALVAYRLRDNWQQAVLTSVMKLIIHPLIVWIVLVPILGVDMAYARFVILVAAMPSGINVYIYATYYKRGEDLAANTVLLTTLFSVFTISAWLIFLA